MKILAVNWQDRENPQAGGAEIHFFEIFRRLVARGHQVTLITSGFAGGPDRATVDGILVRRTAGRHTFAIRGRGGVRRALAEGGWDVVVEDINKLPLYLPALTALPLYVIVPHLFGLTAFRQASWPVAAAVWLAERPIPRVYRGAAFHAISQSTRDDLVRRGVPAGSIGVIYPGVDSGWFTPGAAGRRAATPTFLYVGRLKRYKGLRVAVDAVARARQRGQAIQLDIAGTGDDRSGLERYVRGAGLEGQVRFLGYVDEQRKRELMRAAWAVVLPSAHEGWGMSNVEAAACGTPAVASDSPGLKESVRHGQTGLLVPHGQAEALAAALLHLAGDRELVERLGRAARRFAEGFTWDGAAAATEAHLHETIRGAPRGARSAA
ncbi:MAG TPA: glycosyltransferase family 4 protein [Gemmatimonadales bacterium]|nr:glycosyltransferase family 4 protein [Gemmatimonadales bacterium]